MGKLTVSVAPSVEPITTAEAKEWLRIDTSDTSQDAVLAIVIKGVRQLLEESLNRTLIDTTYAYEMHGRDMVSPISLPKPDVQSITSLTTYEDVSGSETPTVVASSDYQLTGGQYLVERNNGWTINREYRAGTLVYVAGYGAAGSNVPQDIIAAMLEIIALRWENRGDYGNFVSRTDNTEIETTILAGLSHRRIYN